VSERLLFYYQMSNFSTISWWNKLHFDKMKMIVMSTLNQVS